MTITLSDRLRTAAEFAEGRTLADIGTDHAFLPISLCLSGLLDRAYACDIRTGPLEKAEANIRAYGLQNRIETRLGDGLAPIAPGEAECVAIAGMGGARIESILRARPLTAQSAKRLVLQPQHEIPRLRRALHQMDYVIDDEKMIREQENAAERFYTVIAARPRGGGETVCPWRDAEYLLGKHEPARNSAVWRRYATREIERTEAYLSRTDAAERRAELETRLSIYREALR